MIGIATAARTACAAVLVGAAPLGLTTGTTHAAPDPPSGEGTSRLTTGLTIPACRFLETQPLSPRA